MLPTKPIRTERIENLIKLVTTRKPLICIERACYLIKSFKETEADYNVKRRAKEVEKILNKMNIYILLGSLIVGNQASRPRSAPLFTDSFVK